MLYRQKCAVKSISAGAKDQAENRSGRKIGLVIIIVAIAIIEDWEAFILDDRDGHDDDNEPDFPT